MNIDCVFSRLFAGKLHGAALLACCLASTPSASAQATASVEFVADQYGLGAHLAAGRGSARTTVVGLGTAYSNAWELVDICFAPCRARLPVGPQRLAMSVDGDWPSGLNHLVNIEEGGRYRLEYEDRAAIRIAGGVTLGLSLAVMIAGAIMVGAGYSYGTADRTLGDAGVVVAGASIVVMFVSMAVIGIGDHRDIVQIDQNGAIRF